ncbi:hypothetical protein LX32DRAFT_99549 [Colletotrichum zoysiae]|uniref:Uncharacterized protein n=1 Tax=Colletotrichum zoysiae TaxID=1216348 RepID=A0AAD9LZZ4_9PEZI|nr:hypothetical protein LX32DRAFT_99549 [Colletotrichum zoysiae]
MRCDQAKRRHGAVHFPFPLYKSAWYWFSLLTPACLPASLCLFVGWLREDGRMSLKFLWTWQQIRNKIKYPPSPSLSLSLSSALPTIGLLAVGESSQDEEQTESRLTLNRGGGFMTCHLLPPYQASSSDAPPIDLI